MFSLQRAADSPLASALEDNCAWGSSAMGQKAQLFLIQAEPYVGFAVAMVPAGWASRAGLFHRPNQVYSSFCPSWALTPNKVLHPNVSEPISGKIAYNLHSAMKSLYHYKQVYQVLRLACGLPEIKRRSQVARLVGIYLYHWVILLTPQLKIFSYSTGEAHQENDRRPLLLSVRNPHLRAAESYWSRGTTFLALLLDGCISDLGTDA